MHKFTPFLRKLTVPLFAVFASLVAGTGFIIAAGVNPLTGYAALFEAGFGCSRFPQFCALLTTLQYATPLILSGLSAVVAFQAGIFSIGQAGQMILGAGYATMIATRFDTSAGLLPIFALAAGFIAGAVYGLIPGYLKVKLNINEVITTLIFNAIAIVFVGSVGFFRIPEEAQLAGLAAGSKLNTGLFIALLFAGIIFIYLKRTTAGYEMRMAGKAKLFARFGGIKGDRAVIWAMGISGGLAGLAGAIEVLGVQYRFVTQFSSIDDFDGIIVALMGQLHPLGVLLSAFFLGGIRLGALNGLQIQASIPRELGSALIAFFVLFVSAPQLYRKFTKEKGAQIADALK